MFNHDERFISAAWYIHLNTAFRIKSLGIPPVDTVPHFILKVFRLKACVNVTLCKFTVHFTSQYSATFYFHGGQTDSLWERNYGRWSYG